MPGHPVNGTVDEAAQDERVEETSSHPPDSTLSKPPDDSKGKVEDESNRHAVEDEESDEDDSEHHSDADDHKHVENNLYAEPKETKTTSSPVAAATVAAAGTVAAAATAAASSSPASAAVTNHEDEEAESSDDDLSDVNDTEEPTYSNPTSNKPVIAAPPHTLYSVQATHKYTREDVDELSFEPGEIIYIIPFDNPEEQDDGWQMGIKQSDGIKGVFPENFTQRI